MKRGIKIGSYQHRFGKRSKSSAFNFWIKYRNLMERHQTISLGELEAFNYERQEIECHQYNSFEPWNQNVGLKHNSFRLAANEN